jgi:hypothetical protein
MYFDKIMGGFSRLYRRYPNTLYYTILYMLSTVFEDFDKDFQIALADAALITAKGFWLNMWGYSFRIDRFPKEQDEDYRRRILGILNHGKVTNKALIEAVRPYSATAPTITQHTGKVLTNDDYSSYNYDVNFAKNAYIAELHFRQDSMNDINFFVGKSYIGRKTYLFNPLRNRYSTDLVESIVDDLKMAGTKVLLKSQ